MTQQGFGQYGVGDDRTRGIDPNDLMGYSNNFNNTSQGSNAFGSNSAVFGDDELLDSLGSPTDGPGGVPGQDFNNGMSDMSMGYNHQIYNSHHGMDQGGMNGYSHTPDGDPIQSPFVHSFGNSGFRHFNNVPHSMGTSLQSPVSFSGSPLAGSDMNGDPSDPNFLNVKNNRARMAQAMQRKGSNQPSPMTAKSAMHGVGSQDSPGGFGAHTVRGQSLHEKSGSGQWLGSPPNNANNMASSYGSGFSPGQPGLAQLNEVMMKGGTSMPAKLNTPQGGNVNVASQEAKRKRRRESHNLVERRRRDNINERIQDLSKIVPAHRLEDEKIRKMIQNGTPLSPSLTGISSPSQATSGLAGPGARRATGGAAGNITTGLPMEDKDKGPNKGDILNGSVSWTRDLIWLINLKIQQQEELMNYIAELGGHWPFEPTEDEKRMQSEVLDVLLKMDPPAYSRTAGTGLRVPNHTDYRGEPLDGSNADVSIDPSASHLMGGDLNSTSEFWNDPDDDESNNNHNNHNSLQFKEEDEFGMDLG